MIATKVRTVNETKKVLAKVRQSEFKSLGHAGGAIRLTAQRTIKTSPTASEPGTPPHTRRGQLKRAIAYAVAADKTSVVVGPQEEVVGQAGKAHEAGGRYRKERYPKRPFMGPALEKVRDRLAKFWADSVS